jgi:membrane protein DedA with SNARE-associated domain
MTTMMAEPTQETRREAGPAIDPPPQECFRCGYDLRGINDAQPCPECGLLAARSRRATDELHNTRPRWLRRLGWGVRLMLLAIVITAVWPACVGLLYQVPAPVVFFSRTSWFMEWLPFLGYDAAALMLWVGATLLSTREGYAPADEDDAWLRRLLPVAAIAPLLGLVLLHVELSLRARRGWVVYSDEWTLLQLAIPGLLTLGSIPLPLLVFTRLRGLAKRARSAHLAEHCLIVGAGTSASLLVALVIIVIFENARDWGLGGYWIERSPAAIALMLLLAVCAFLFTMWSMYLLGRFALAFFAASRKLRRAWTRDDRSQPT